MAWKWHDVAWRDMKAMKGQPLRKVSLSWRPQQPYYQYQQWLDWKGLKGRPPLNTPRHNPLSRFEDSIRTASLTGQSWGSQLASLSLEWGNRLPHSPEFAVHPSVAWNLWFHDASGNESNPSSTVKAACSLFCSLFVHLGHAKLAKNKNISEAP